MKVLYVASEGYPFIKTGGLADVSGSLPKALKKNGCDIRVVMPLYSKVDYKFKNNMEKVGHFYVDLGWRRQYAGVYSMEYKGVTHYFIDNEFYFKREGVYGEPDDGERFIFFSKAVTMLPRFLSFKPDIVHSNDWHTGLVSLYIKDFAKGDPFYRDIKTLYTIHNLKYQGVFPAWILEDIGGLSGEYIKDNGVRFGDESINFMKAGIVYSDRVNTVSQTYSEEMKYDFFGENLNGIIRAHENKVSGIINGIDYELYNPKKDKNIVENYDERSIEKKRKNKRELQKMYNLPERDDVPLIAMVSRLVDMKGLDLINFIMDELLQEDLQFVVLGTGDIKYEDMFRWTQIKYPEKLAARIYFNPKESHKIYAGADILMMPSMAEPCGISQLIALRYGTIPIVRETGGLKDTVEAYNEYSQTGNGFSFKNYNAHELLFTTKMALDVYKDEEVWAGLIKRAMESKNNWDNSSKEYMKLYKDMCYYG